MRHANLRRRQCSLAGRLEPVELDVDGLVFDTAELHGLIIVGTHDEAQQRSAHRRGIDCEQVDDAGRRKRLAFSLNGHGNSELVRL